MGRWTSHFREQQPRDWMIPGRHAAASPAPAGNARPGSAEIAQAAVVVLESPRDSGPVRPRGPLRRQVGVPDPLETPLFVHRAALSRLELERRRQRRTVVAVVGASLAASVALRALLGG